MTKYCEKVFTTLMTDKRLCPQSTKNYKKLLRKINALIENGQ